MLNEYIEKIYRKKSYGNELIHYSNAKYSLCTRYSANNFYFVNLSINLDEPTQDD